VDWTRPADEIARTIRGLSPFPGAWTTVGGKRLKLLGARAVEGSGAPGKVLSGLTVAAGDGAVELTRVQPEGRPPMAAGDYLRGARLAPGDVFGED
jgi:methionyl-tRNA formyltransferase